MKALLYELNFNDEAKAKDVKWAKIKIELSGRVLNDNFCHDMQIILENQILI